MISVGPASETAGSVCLLENSMRGFSLASGEARERRSAGAQGDGVGTVDVSTAVGSRAKRTRSGQSVGVSLGSFCLLCRIPRPRDSSGKGCNGGRASCSRDPHHERLSRRADLSRKGGTGPIPVLRLQPLNAQQKFPDTGSGIPCFCHAGSRLKTLNMRSFPRTSWEKTSPNFSNFPVLSAPFPAPVPQASAGPKSKAPRSVAGISEPSL